MKKWRGLEQKYVFIYFFIVVNWFLFRYQYSLQNAGMEHDEIPEDGFAPIVERNKKVTSSTKFFFDFVDNLNVTINRSKSLAAFSATWRFRWNYNESFVAPKISIIWKKFMISQICIRFYEDQQRARHRFKSAIVETANFFWNCLNMDVRTLITASASK